MKLAMAAAIQLAAMGAVVRQGPDVLAEEGLIMNPDPLQVIPETRTISADEWRRFAAPSEADKAAKTAAEAKRQRRAEHLRKAQAHGGIA